MRDIIFYCKFYERDILRTKDPRYYSSDSMKNQSCRISECLECTYCWLLKFQGKSTELLVLIVTFISCSPLRCTWVIIYIKNRLVSENLLFRATRFGKFEERVKCEFKCTACEFIKWKANIVGTVHASNSIKILYNIDISYFDLPFFSPFFLYPT